MSAENRRLVCVVLLAGLVAACGENGFPVPTAPSDDSLHGTWIGWFSSITTGTRTVTATLFQVGSVISGFWTIVDTSGVMSGNLTGSVVGSTALLTLHQTVSAGCSLSVIAIVTSATRLEGSWSSIDCEPRDVGTFRLTRE